MFHGLKQNKFKRDSLTLTLGLLIELNTQRFFFIVKSLNSDVVVFTTGLQNDHKVITTIEINLIKNFNYDDCLKKNLLESVLKESTAIYRL